MKFSAACGILLLEHENFWPGRLKICCRYFLIGMGYVLLLWHVDTQLENNVSQIFIRKGVQIYYILTQIMSKLLLHVVIKWVSTLTNLSIVMAELINVKART